MYLPVLPRSLLGVLQAPTPFVGMRSRLFEQVCFRPADAGGRTQDARRPCRARPRPGRAYP